MASALLLARTPAAAGKTRLEPLLGPAGCARLQAALVARAARWAQAAAPGAAFLSYTADPGPLRALIPEGMRLFPQVDGHLGERILAATAHVFSLAGGPLLLIGSDVVALAPGHARAALADLDAGGCDVTIGPATDGGYYLLGLRRPRPELFALPAEAWGGPEVFRLTLDAAFAAGLRVGLLRAERDLDEPADVRALLADPLTPDDVRAALGG